MLNFTISQLRDNTLDGGSRPAPEYNYRCEGMPNGKYIHPTDCTRYLVCLDDMAYEFDCEDCNENDNPGRCRDGRTVYDPDLQLCNWADVTECRVGEDMESIEL